MQERQKVTTHWEALLSERLRTRRARRGWRQVDVANKMKARGFDWTQPVVAMVESGRRDCGLLELAALASCFRRSVKGFLALDDDRDGYALDGVDPPASLAEVRIEFGPGVHIELASFLGTLDGSDGFFIQGGPTLLDWTSAEDPMVTKLARVLGIDAGEVLTVARRLWGREPQLERDRRLGDVTDLPARTVQARRGHITRAMTTEIREELH